MARCDYKKCMNSVGCSKTVALSMWKGCDQGAVLIHNTSDGKIVWASLFAACYGRNVINVTFHSRIVR